MQPDLCADVRRWIRQGIHSNALTLPPPALSAHVATCSQCRAAVLLAADIVDGAPPRIDHPECEERLAPYVELIVEGDLVAALHTYRSVWWHVWTCADCAEVCHLAHVLMLAEREGQITMPQLRPTPPSEPFLRLARQVVTVALGIGGPALGTARGSDKDEIVIYDGDLSGGHHVIVQIQEHSATVCCVSVTLDPPARGNLLVTLGDQSFRSPFNAVGSAQVELPTALLTAPDGPPLMFEIEPYTDGYESQGESNV